MTSPPVREYAQAARARYEAEERQEKKRIMDEFCQTTGCTARRRSGCWTGGRGQGQAGAGDHGARVRR